MINFFDNFDTLINAPNDVVKLRELILQLAVQGKLVPQDAKDEPASLLLADIRKRRQNQTKEKKECADTLMSASDIKPPFGLAKGWVWSKFSDVATIATNLVKPEMYCDMPHLAPDNIEKATGILLPCRTVREDDVRSPNHRFFPGQIVYSKIRPNLAKATIVDFGGLCSADMYPIVVHIYPKFLLLYMLSKTFVGMTVKNDTRVAMPKINQQELNRIPVPLPPLPEQHRIVAKVDKLMTLCDALEIRLTQGQTLSQQLLESTIHDLLAA